MAREPLRKISADEFVRRLKPDTGRANNPFALFVGAGCSVSSGIPAAAALVKDNWLPRLRDVAAPERTDLGAWAKEEIASYKQNSPAAAYGEVMERLFLHPEERQREVEALCEGRFPGFGYAVLANLMALPGGCFNVALTTNFDDLIPDALYLISHARPLVIHHESLATFIRPTRTSPLVVKLHGDHRLSPQNTTDETDRLKTDTEQHVRALLHDRGLIFVGYGGNDKGILRMLKGLPEEALPLGVYWVGGSEPRGAIRPWLHSRNAIWVEKGDFDEVMLLFRDIFDLPPPDRSHFDDVFDRYTETYKTLSKRVVSLPDSAPDAAALKTAVKSADEALPDWRAALLEAYRLEQSDPDEADNCYADAARQFPDNANVLGAYAVFLRNVRQDFDRAEDLFRRAINADPIDATNLGNYALFLENIRQDFDRAKDLYRRAIGADPNHANNLGNHAVFLQRIRQDFDRAEEFYRRAIGADPSHANTLGNYANFVADVRKDQGRAEELYRRAIDADPNHVGNLGNYANFVASIRKDFDRADDLYRRAIDAVPNHANTLGNYAGFLLTCGRKEEGLGVLSNVLRLPESREPGELAAEAWFYALVHRAAEEGDEALRSLKAILVAGGRSPGWDLNQHLDRAREAGHPDVEWLERIAAVISEGADISELDDWPAWQDA